VGVQGRYLGRVGLGAVDDEDLGAGGVEGEEGGWGGGGGEDDGGEGVAGEIVGFVEGVAWGVLVRGVWRGMGMGCLAYL
jgi:hypothetical protein